jgi:hypothetical protein
LARRQPQVLYASKVSGWSARRLKEIKMDTLIEIETAKFLSPSACDCTARCNGDLNLEWEVSLGVIFSKVALKT